MTTNKEQYEQTRIGQVYTNLRRVIRYIFMFGFFTNLLVLALPLFSLQVFDRVLSSKSVSTLLWLFIIVAGLLITMGLLQVARSMMMIRVSQWIDQHLSSHLLKDSVAISASSGLPAGSQNMRDLGTVKSFITGDGIISLMDAPWAVIYLSVVFFISIPMGVLILGGGIILFLLALVNNKVTKDDLAKASKHSVNSYNQVESITRNSEVIEALGMIDKVTHHWQKENSQLLHYQSQASALSAAILTTSQIFRMLLQASIMGAGAYLAISGALTPGGMIACSILSSRALAPFEKSIASWKNVKGFLSSYRNLDQVMRDAPKRTASTKLPTPEGRVNVEHLAFTPKGVEHPIFQDINFELLPGDSLALIGPSGAGKTTLMKIMAGIIPAGKGTVRLDGADVYKWNRAEFGRHVGYLPQDIELFAGSIRDNIARLDEEADHDEVFKAAKITAVHDLVLRFEHGYDTVIGPGGVGLSGGQRQRVGLARAFYGNPKLILLDEPNANLDKIGEAGLKRALEYAKENKSTVVITTHQQSILSHVDKIALVDGGSLQAFGTRDQVLNALREKALSSMRQPGQSTAQMQRPAANMQGVPRPPMPPKAAVPQPQMRPVTSGQAQPNGNDAATPKASYSLNGSQSQQSTELVKPKERRSTQKEEQPAPAHMHDAEKIEGIGVAIPQKQKKEARS